MFRVIPRGSFIPAAGNRSVYLKTDNWNDFSYVTLFNMSLHDEQGQLHDLGSVKIGFVGQTTSVATYQKLPEFFERVGEGFFSLGQSVDFYKGMARLSPTFRGQVLAGLADVVLDPEIIDRISHEDVFKTSLLRTVSLSAVRGQFARVLAGGVERTNYNFSFARPPSGSLGQIALDFDVVALSTPSTNIHAVIGRNGVGKTTLLNGMISAVVDASSESKFLERTFFGSSEIARDYFSSLVSVSFSAFDPFDPPLEQPDPARGTCYFYIGLKGGRDGVHRSSAEIRSDCARYLISCFMHSEKAARWLGAIERLGSDENFNSMGLVRLKESYEALASNLSSDVQVDSEIFLQRYLQEVAGFLGRMSSGHAVVLLTMTFLVARVEEKTLVLLDEPESHLHPPLLSAFIRALSDLLHDRNGVAIVATHSPVVLQEIPRSCVWKVGRVGRETSRSRPDIETFAENVGLLTSEVFKLEVERSGFHALLAADVALGKTYDEVLQQYNGQLGFEGRAILAALIAARRADMSSAQ